MAAAEEVFEVFDPGCWMRRCGKWASLRISAKNASGEQASFHRSARKRLTSNEANYVSDRATGDVQDRNQKWHQRGRTRFSTEIPWPREAQKSTKTEIRHSTIFEKVVDSGYFCASCGKFLFVATMRTVIVLASLINIEGSPHGILTLLDRRAG